MSDQLTIVVTILGAVALTLFGFIYQVDARTDLAHRAITVCESHGGVVDVGRDGYVTCKVHPMLSNTCTAAQTPTWNGIVWVCPNITVPAPAPRFGSDDGSRVFPDMFTPWPPTR